MEPSRKNKAGLALLALAILLTPAFLYGPVLLHLRAVSVLLGSESTAPPGWLPPCVRAPVRVEELTGEPGAGPGRARLYLPRDPSGAPGVVLVHGIHHLGIDEPRLTAFARALASAGMAVFTPEFAELTDYRIEETTIATIGSTARFLARRTGRRTAGVIGISFAGGLALLAATDPRLGASIGFVVCMGAHHDLRRVARYYAGQQPRDPEGRVYPVPAHPYGARVLIYAYLADVFETEDLPVARQVLRTYLHDRHRVAREMAGSMSEPARDRMLRILDRKEKRTAGAALRAILARRKADLLRVSPSGRLSGLRTPVLLIHGSDDPVVPSTETRWLEREIPAGALRRALVSPLLRHAEMEHHATLADRWALIRFTADLIAAAYRQPGAGR